jgi:hypothetical protein
MKLKKHQPNIKSLIHLYANGVKRELCCGNVSSSEKDQQGDSCLYTYSVRLATRRQVGENVVYIVNAKNYSVSSSRHKRYLYNSIASELRSSHIAPDNGLDFEASRKKFKWFLNKGYAITIPSSLSLDFGFSSTTEYGINVLSEFIRKMQNKRVTKVTTWDVHNNFLLLLKLQWYEKKFELPKSSKLAGIANRFARVARECLERISKRQEDLLKRKAEDEGKAFRFVENLVEQHSEGWKQAVDTLAQRYREDLTLWKRGANLRTELPSWIQHQMTDEAVQVRELWLTLNRKFYAHQFTRLVDLFEHLYLKLNPEGTLLDEAMHDKLRLAYGDTVETSRGARLSVLLVRQCYQRWKPELLQDDVVFGREERVGVYPLRSIKDGIVTIGCHTIRTKEITELAEQNGW